MKKPQTNNKNNTQPVRHSSRVKNKSQKSQENNPTNSTSHDDTFSNVSITKYTKSKNKEKIFLKKLKNNKIQFNNELEIPQKKLCESIVPVLPSLQNTYSTKDKFYLIINDDIQINNVNEDHQIVETSMEGTIQKEIEKFTISNLETKKKNYFQFLEN